MSAVWIRQLKKNFVHSFERYFGCSWPGWIRALIWIATFTVLAGLMARELRSNLDDYNWNNIVPEMNVVSSELNPPNLTVCAPYYSSVLDTVADWVMNERNRKHNRSIPYKPCHECKGMINNSWDVWQDEEMFAQENSPSVQLAIALVKKVVDSIEIANATLLNKNNAHWDQAIIDALWLFVSCRAIGDNHFFKADFYQRYYVYSCVTMNLSSLDYIPDETFDQLNDLLLDSMNIYVHLFVDPPGTSGDNVPLKQIEGFRLLGWGMCFRIPQHALTTAFLYSGNVTYPGTSEYYYPWMQANFPPEVQESFLVYEDTVLYNFGDTTVTLCQLDFGLAAVQLTYNLQTYMDVRGRDSTCSKDNIPMSCVAKLQFANAVKYCGCVPFLHRYLRGNDTNLPYCKASLYEACKGLKPNLLDYSNCTRRCEYADYKFWTDLNHTYLNSSETRGMMGLLLSLAPANGSTLKIDFTSKTTLAQFMSQIGGSVNLYLGLSGFTVCAFFFFLIDRAKQCHQRGNNSVNSGQHSPILGFHSLWFVRALQTLAKQDMGDKGQMPDDDTIIKMMKKVEIVADRLDALEGKHGKLDEDKIMKNLETIEKRLDDLGEKYGKTEVDRMFMKKLEAVMRLGEKRGKPDDDAITTIRNRFDALEGNRGKFDDDEIAAIWKNLETVVDRLNALERNGRNAPNSHKEQSAPSVSVETTIIKL